MAVTNFYTVNGEIIGEKTTGGTRVDYLTDALGSVTATVNSSAQVVNTYRYKPYGKLLAKTGNGPDPAFSWVGSQGYRPTQKKFCDFYVRARHPDTYTGRWTTKDPYIFWLRRGSYRYADDLPVLYGDWSGLSCMLPSQGDCCTKKAGQISGSYRCAGTWKRIPGYESGDGPVPGCSKSGLCGDIIESIRFAVGYCADFCDRSTEPGSGSYPSGAPVWAVQLCCIQDGRSVDCGVYWCEENNPKRADGSAQDPCVLGCLFTHERRHSRQNMYQCSGDVSPIQYPANRDAWAECDAYYTQLLCLLDAAKKRCPADAFGPGGNFKDTGLFGAIFDCISAANRAGVIPGQRPGPGTVASIYLGVVPENLVG